MYSLKNKPKNKPKLLKKSKKTYIIYMKLINNTL